MNGNKLPGSFYTPEELAEKERVAKAAAEAAAKQKQAQPSPAPQGGEIGNADQKTIVVAPKQEQKADTGPKPMVTVGESGALDPRDIDQQWRMACALSQTGMLGPTYEGKPGAIMLAINLAMEKGKNPFSYLTSTYEIKGKITEWGADALGAVFASGLVKTFKVVYLSKDGKQLDEFDVITPVWAVAVLGERTDPPIRCIRYFTEADAIKAKLSEKDTYKQYPRRMYETKAVGALLKIVWPDVIAGIKMPEYDEHEPEPKTITQTTTGGAKARLLSDQSEATATSEGATVPGVREEAVRSVPRENVQGDAAGSPGQPDPVVQNSPQRAAQELVQVPKQVPKGATRTRGKRVGDPSSSLSS